MMQRQLLASVIWCTRAGDAIGCSCLLSPEALSVPLLCRPRVSTWLSSLTRLQQAAHPAAASSCRRMRSGSGPTTCAPRFATSCWRGGLRWGHRLAAALAESCPHLQRLQHACTVAASNWRRAVHQ